MGSALSTGGGLTLSQKRRADTMNISYGDFKQMLVNKMKIEAKNLKQEGKSTAPKKKEGSGSHSQTKPASSSGTHQTGRKSSKKPKGSKGR